MRRFLLFFDRFAAFVTGLTTCGCSTDAAAAVSRLAWIENVAGLALTLTAYDSWLCPPRLDSKLTCSLSIGD